MGQHNTTMFLSDNAFLCLAKSHKWNVMEDDKFDEETIGFIFTVYYGINLYYMFIRFMRLNSIGVNSQLKILSLLVMTSTFMLSSWE